MACNGVLTSPPQQKQPLQKTPYTPLALKLFNSPVLKLFNCPKFSNILLPPWTGNKQDVKLMHKSLIEHNYQQIKKKKQI